MDFVLPALVLVPLITAMVIVVLPANPGNEKGLRSLAGMVALAGSMLTFGVSLVVLSEFVANDGGFQFVWTQTWWEQVGLSLAFGVDGISLFMVVLTGLLWPVALVTSSAKHDTRSYYFWLMLLMAGTMGAFIALDLLLFFLFFEIVLVPMYFLIGGWGYGNRLYASMKFFIFTMAASALMLVGMIALVILASSDGVLSFDYRDLRPVVADPDFITENRTALNFIFASFALAFSVKVPVFPIHTWLPDAHTEAPTAGSVILAGVLLKLGAYGFIRFGIGLFPEQIEQFAPLFLTLGVIGIVYGAAVATMQKDLKRLVAYSSVAHMGFIVLGIFAFNHQGTEGAVLQMINHGISTGALFILVGWIYDRRKTRKISELSGMQKAAPIMAGVFTLVMLSSIGLPGLNGFVGEFLILLGTFQTGRWWAVVAVTGVILAALYLLWAYQRTFHGKPTGDNANMEDMRPTEFLGILPLLIIIVGMGIYPKPVQERIEPAVDVLLSPPALTIDDTEVAAEDPAKRAGVELVVEAAEKGEKEYKARKAAIKSGDGESADAEVTE